MKYVVSSLEDPCLFYCELVSRSFNDTDRSISAIVIPAD